MPEQVYTLALTGEELAYIVAVLLGDPGLPATLQEKVAQLLEQLARDLQAI